jgi:hypothetical protein
MTEPREDERDEDDDEILDRQREQDIIDGCEGRWWLTGDER